MHYCGKPANGALLLIHGAGNNCTVWEDMGKNMDIPWIAVDLPGHGKSKGEGFDSIEAYADAVEDFVKEKGIRDLVVAGHSMGGAIAQVLLARNPSWAKGGILISTGLRLAVNPAIFKGLKENPSNMIAKISRWAVAKEAPPEVVQKAQTIFSSSPVDVVIKDFQACDAFNGESIASKIKVPVLVIVGSEDIMTPPELSHKLKEAIPSARLEIISGAGHMLQLERPEELARTVVDFIKSL